MMRVIDSHIHVDLYAAGERMQMLSELATYRVEALISVSSNLASSKKNLQLAQQDRRIKSAFGFHPEQIIPTANEIADLQQWIDQNAEEMVAIGEVGLPYYLRKDDPTIQLGAYIEILELFIHQARHLNKPIVLHAIYEDAPRVLDLLEAYSVKQAHFHWFKGDKITLQRMQENGYVISVTPDILYEPEIQALAQFYPLTQIMMETDGPWSFKGPFQNRMTHPSMIHDSVKMLAQLKKLDVNDVYRQVYENTKVFYDLR
ncbi:MAG TPA: TatD family hydrolase [Bacillota bacterium]|nr:TatD family hydrolase [Bacillota bacterium]